MGKGDFGFEDRADADAHTPAHFKVKNTFIDFDDEFGSVNNDEPATQMVWAKQVSEPAPQRQLSSSGSGLAGNCHLNGREGISRVVHDFFAEDTDAEDTDVPSTILASSPMSPAAFAGQYLPPHAQVGPGAWEGASLAVSAGPTETLMGMGGRWPDTTAGSVYDASSGRATPPSLPSCQAASEPPPEWGGATTVMMRNLPNKYTQALLVSEINQGGFLGAFDFLYLPIDPETGANKGYAFINFLAPTQAWMFKVAYEGRKMSTFASNKVVAVAPAALQGFQANYSHYSSARVSRGDPSARPLFLRNGTGAGGQSGPHGDDDGVMSRRGRRRRGGGLSAIDLAARHQQQQQQQQQLQLQQQLQAPASPQAPPQQEPRSPQPRPQFQQRPSRIAVPQQQTLSGPVGQRQAPHAQPRPVQRQPQPHEQDGSGPKARGNFCSSCGGEALHQYQFCQFCGATLPWCSPSARQPAQQLLAQQPPFQSQVSPQTPTSVEEAPIPMYCWMVPQHRSNDHAVAAGVPYSC